MTGVIPIPHLIQRDQADPPQEAVSVSDTAHLPLPQIVGRLAGRIALVSGGGGGCGRAIAQYFVAEGAFVLIGDLNEANAKEAASSLGPNATHIALDVRLPNDWAAAVRLCRERFGAPPDVMVQAAGAMIEGAAETVSEDAMRLSFDVNALGLVHGIQAVVPGMRAAGGGSIVAITSMGGVTFGVPFMTPYCAGKAAATAIVLSAAGELGHDKIRINALVPGQVDTPMSQGADVSASHAFFEKMPIPRIGQPRDIAQAVLFLASQESAWITGTKFLIDGGMSAGPIIG